MARLLVNGLTSSRQPNSRETNSFGTIFNGTPGALATFPGRCDLSEAELAQLIDKDLPLGVLSGLAFMFNFHDDVLSIGHQGISVQLADGTGFSRYTSDWSQSFSLDSVGVSHVCGYVQKRPDCACSPPNPIYLLQTHTLRCNSGCIVKKADTWRCRSG